MTINTHYQRIVPFIIFILALVLLYNLIKPMISIILGSILLAYITFPLYNRISKKITNKFLSIVLSLLIVVIIIMIPFFFLVFEIAQQGYGFYGSLSENIAKGEIFNFGCVSAESKVCALLNQAEKLSSERLSNFGVAEKIQGLLPILEDKLTSFVLAIPLIAVQIFLALVMAYFILKDWKSILKQIIYIIPIRTKTTNRLVKEFGNITYTVVYAQLFVAFVQGVVATIGFFIFGVPFPVLLGLVTAFFALIPSFGTAIIWLPASLFLILIGYFNSDYWMLVKGICLLVYGFVIIGTIDNILLAKIVHAKANVSQILVIMGVIGGVSMFGILGIFIGPILLPLLITYFETFKERFD